MFPTGELYREKAKYLQKQLINNLLILQDMIIS